MNLFGVCRKKGFCVCTLCPQIKVNPKGRPTNKSYAENKYSVAASMTDVELAKWKNTGELPERLQHYQGLFDE